LDSEAVLRKFFRLTLQKIANRLVGNLVAQIGQRPRDPDIARSRFSLAMW